MDKFRVGDTVICIGNRNDNSCGSGWGLGYNFKVTRVSHHPQGNIYWKGVGGAGVYEDSLGLVVSREWNDVENGKV